jgi:stage II sporulation protein D
MRQPGLRRVRTLVAGAACLLASAGALGQSSAGTLVVRVFSTRDLTSLTITPAVSTPKLHPWLRACSGCRREMLSTPLFVNVRSGRIVFSNGMRVSSAELGGALRVHAISAGGGAKEIESAGLWKLTLWHGELRVLLTLDSERYVALVLGGEAAPNEPLESLKAMAVAVRTFALENSRRHAVEGFDLCDSTHCQSLRFAKPLPAVEQAVSDTAGETLWYGGKRASAFYTQDCGGESESARNVWSATNLPYLVAHRDPYCLRREPAHWHAEIAASDVLAIARREGWRMPSHIEGVRILKRTAASRAGEIEFGGDGTRDKVSAGSFRFAVDRSLGWNRIRSDWYIVSLSNGYLHFDGRGYGHGVGLCQAGAFEMAVEGQRYRNILSFYFPGTFVGITPGDHGWHTVDLPRTGQREGTLTFWQVGSSRTNETQADDAWRMATTLFRPESPVNATLRQYPTTELFRQAAGEAGWDAAATRGTQVYLQPESVLMSHGNEHSILLHEFLHVLVESEAEPRSPLWLREGLVEVLANEESRGDAGAAMNIPALDAALAAPEDPQLSQRAHLEAARLTRILIARHGLEQVRQWLREGNVPPAALKELPQVAENPLPVTVSRPAVPQSMER